MAAGLGRILGSRYGFLILSVALCLALGPAAMAQTITDRIAFRMPGLVLAWNGEGPPVRGQAIALAPGPSGCIDFASNSAVEAEILNGGPELALRAVAAGRSARPLGRRAGLALRRHVFAERTALLPDSPRHQAVTLCLDEPPGPAANAADTGPQIALRVLD